MLPRKHLSIPPEGVNRVDAAGQEKGTSWLPCPGGRLKSLRGFDQWQSTFRLVPATQDTHRCPQAVAQAGAHGPVDPDPTLLATEGGKDRREQKGVPVGRKLPSRQ